VLPGTFDDASTAHSFEATTAIPPQTAAREPLFAVMNLALDRRFGGVGNETDQRSISPLAAPATLGRNPATSFAKGIKK
jgi:hypothetical protein